jgi:hypothetical protein
MLIGLDWICVFVVLFSCVPLMLFLPNLIVFQAPQWDFQHLNATDMASKLSGL